MKLQFKQLAFATSIIVFFLVSCTNSGKTESDHHSNENSSVPETNVMTSAISMFEIPVIDISRAIQFYQNILNIHIEKMEMEGMQMGIFPYENQVVTGVLIQAEGYVPSANGVTIYLNAGNDLQPALDKVKDHGGDILLPKTAHADSSGFFAFILDSEGNKIALNSPN